MTTLSPVVDALLKVFEKDLPSRKGDHRFTVSRTVSAFAVLYEKARNAVEFRAEHLVRRAAIERILKRRIMLDGNPESIAETLLLELLWAKYIDSSFIDTPTIHAVAKTLHRYFHIKQIAFSSGSPRYEGITWDTIVGIASAEIDEIIVPAEKREALINFVYQAIREKIKLHTGSEQELNTYTYIAVERTFAQSDNALITYHLLRNIIPSWQHMEGDTVTKEATSCIKAIQSITQALNTPIVTAIGRYLRKQLPPFLILRDFLFEKGKDARTIISEPQKFEEALAATTQRRYEQTGEKVRRAVVRSIIYIFLTKMVFALALETPFDLFIAKKVDYIPLAINALFPPLLIFLLASFITIPKMDNTKRIIERMKLLIYHFEDFQHGPDTFEPKAAKRRPLLTAVFTVIYLIGFIITFGFITLVLTKLHFNIASQTIFLFFVALVSVFAYRIRQSAKEYEIIERQGIFEPLIDFFFLPILWAGDLLSKEIAKINIFIFIFDFVLEAPLKVIFEVIEEWIRFIRTKKEEIV